VSDLLPIGGLGGRRRRAGRVINRAELLGEITTHRGLPVTTLERTLLDLAASAPASRLQKAVERAEWLRLIDMRKVREGGRDRAGCGRRWRSR
jgi:hypothetical protein